MKILCILLPHFPLRCEIQRNPGINKREILITYQAGSQKLVLDYTPELDGLQRDMPLQQAISRYGDIELLQADIPYYEDIFNRILDLLAEKCPLIEGYDLECVYLGMEGMQLIYPDDNKLISAIRETLPEILGARMGIAHNKFTAYLAAFYSSPGKYHVLSDNPESFLADISCDILPVSDKIKNKLRDMGMHTLKQVADLSPGPLQAQLGPEGARIWNLARGNDATPLYPRCTKENIADSFTLSSVTISLEALLVIWESLLSRVFVRLSTRGLGIRSILFWTLSWQSEHWNHIIKFKEPAMDVPDVMRRLKQILEKYPQPGPVERLGMEITGVGRRSGRQKSLFTEVRARDRLLDDIKQLEMRLGSPQIFKLKEVEPWSRIPERRYALVPLNR